MPTYNSEASPHQMHVGVGFMQWPCPSVCLFVRLSVV